MKHSHKNDKDKKSKVKKKVGKMKVSCEKCGSAIVNLTESRQEFRLKLRGFCESCNKFKVAYIDNHKAIAESGNMFDYLVRENLPPTAQPLPQNNNAQAQKPANPTSTTTPQPSAQQPAQQQTQQPPKQPAANDALKTAINSDTGKAFASMLGMAADQLHKVLTTTSTAQPTSTAAPQASAQKTP
jgi:hypothetical protein